MKKILLAALLGAMTLSATAAEKETIRFATEATYAPFEMFDANNQIVGFDVDLANAMCDKINATCTFTHQSFDSLIPSLKFRRFDALMAGIDITPDRQKQVDFTDTYYANSAEFIAVKDKITSPAQLKGKKIGVQNGTTHQKYIMEQLKDMSTVPYDNYQSAILDLQSGRIDAVFGDTAVADEWLKAKGNENLAVVGDKVTDPEYFGIGLGIAVRKGNKDLQDKLNKAMSEVKADGTYDVIYKKWFE
ncbi:arginine ABC transporter substrate-binding protein [Moellerella wisconsensis]|uniref:Arginine ABC transporter substrate-binding protein n=2 Tax=Moellerella wisconsensis TaxID=158849 RepID=A0A9Q8Q228_9GAMM|nr:arginine ABC transporter substrate-binding protein [Moellerella wisconsensis]KLN96120.1 arginine ABC transporter substrate-binding protein [Moellerella wisconsensis]UNH24994.1 arginine ABC transporter substrate-binding protein [Moellerella wisconsensis]UNH28105.1 arginine ABC transporter substrate-binding protein [Moellerella wisconsensis]UNH31613.1 arginine ABC transporter substrate-binding protein [Moellerella wisconsensis]UNH39718.1 arginine ABC transporter substrate-binding protein [Moe